MLTFRSERGDTLIEVLLATVVLSIVTVSTFTIMNKGIALSQEVLERTEARARLSEQLELATYFRDRYNEQLLAGQPTTQYPASVWAGLKSRNTGAASGTAPTKCSHNQGFTFQLNGAGQYEVADYNAASSTAAVKPVAGSGLWLEMARSPGGIDPPYVDIFAKSCWNALGGNVGTVSSAVRLYDR